jgi:hypothetical protein
MAIPMDYDNLRSDESSERASSIEEQMNGLPKLLRRLKELML